MVLLEEAREDDPVGAADDPHGWTLEAPRRRAQGYRVEVSHDATLYLVPETTGAQPGGYRAP